MSNEPTDQTPAKPEPASPQQPSTWMSDATLNSLRAKHAELIREAQEDDRRVETARKELVNAEQHLQACQTLAQKTRTQLEETKVLLRIAEGNAPRPTPLNVQADGTSLRFGKLRVAGLPDDATRDEYMEHAALMRQIMAAALDVADTTDKAAATAPRRRWTPDKVNPDGSTTITMKRACNGCGEPLGDATAEELNAAAEGRRPSDVRDECPRCSAPREDEEPATATGAGPLTLQPAPAPGAAETITDTPVAAQGGEDQ